jgi:hypothetical protein
MMQDNETTQRVKDAMNNVQKVPEEKVIAMREYAKKLRKKYPKKSMTWLTRQVATHFKVNLK